MRKRSSFVWMFVAFVVSFEVRGAPAPVITSFTATPASINPGGTSTLSWTTQNSIYVIIDHGVGTQPANGSVAVSPTINTTYTLSAAGNGPTPAIASTTVTVIGSTPTQPVITSFTASPATINVGESATLSWTTQQALTAFIDQGVGPQPVNGSVRVSPTITTKYTLSTSGSSPPPAIASTTITVIAEPRVVVSSPPRGMVHLAAVGGGTDEFTLTNIGSVTAFVTLTKNGNFFTINAQDLVIDPKSSHTISIAGFEKTAGAYEGNVTVSGAGADGLSVAVRLLSSAAPTGTVAGRASQSRAEINAPAGQSASGFVQFRNDGNSTLQGIAVSDVPWLVPQSGVISIAPGQTVSVSYTVDSNKRPDADAPIGAVTGSLSLVFLRGSSTPAVSDNAPGTTQVSVTLVYVVKPGTLPGIPPALATNEVALFVPGLANRTNATGDFMLSNKSTGTLNDVKLYLLAPGAPSQLATFPTVPGGSSALFPGLLKNVFAASALTGTAQVRTTDVSKISVAGIQTDSSSPSGTFSTALPVLRSDRGAGSGGTVVLAGVLKDAGVQTNMYVQELSGNTASVRIESLDAAGSVIETRTPSAISAFGLIEVTDFPRAGAAAARVVNFGPGRIEAFALVANVGAGDSWLITDPGVMSSSDGVLIIPLFSAGTGADTYLYGTNRLTSAVSTTIDIHGGGRRRAVGGSDGVIRFANETVALPPEQSFSRKLTASIGYIRIAAPPNAISAVGRTSRSNPGQGAYGAGLPAVPASSALQAGESKRFAGIDDASASTRAASAAGTFRSNLMLIETANAPAVVRLTLRYTFAAGSTVSARGVSTRDYTVGASQFLLISDVIAEVVGLQRATFGDLRNIDMDVEVVSGRIIPVLQSIDNGSDDSNVRVE